MMSLTLQKGCVHTTWFKVGTKDSQGISDLKGLARKDIQINIIKFFNKVRCNIGSFNKLYKGVALLGASSEHDDTGRSVANHINPLNELLCKGRYSRLGPQGHWIAFASVHD